MSRKIILELTEKQAIALLALADEGRAGILIDPEQIKAVLGGDPRPAINALNKLEQAIYSRPKSTQHDKE